MVYALVWAPTVRDQLAALEKEVRARLIAKAVEASDAPHHYLERLSGHKLWKLRAGDYRAIIELDDAGKRMVVLKAGHRKNIYQ